MSIAQGSPTIAPMIDPGLREAQDRRSRLSRLRRAAIVAAALFHLVVIAVVLIPWLSLFHAQPLPPPIAVTLVTEPPPPPPPPPPPSPKPQPPKAQPQPPPPEVKERVSGADSETTSPRAAEKAPEEAAPPAPTPPPQDVPSKTVEAVPKQSPNPAKDLHVTKRKLAERETAPKVLRGSINRALGETEQEGDPYLNHLQALIEEHRTAPPNAVGSLGLPLEGTSVYLIQIGSDGALLSLRLERSAGADVLDQAVAHMIEAAAPFPPPPRYFFLGPAVVLEASIPISSRGSP